MNTLTKIKLCGLSRPEDVAAANALQPDCIGFVFAPGSRRYVTPETAAALRERLSPDISAVGVFVDESPETVAALLDSGTIDAAQLHGHEDAAYLRRLRALTAKPVLQAFRVSTAADLRRARDSGADRILLDSGAGTGQPFNWSLLSGFDRPYFLAGGLDAGNVREAVETLRPYGVDASSGLETDGRKDPAKMAAFVRAVRDADHNSYRGEFS